MKGHCEYEPTYHVVFVDCLLLHVSRQYKSMRLLAYIKKKHVQ